MTVYKETYIDVAVDVELGDFDIEDICNYIKKLRYSDTCTPYEEETINNLNRNLTNMYSNTPMENFVYELNREQFEELFNLMKTSWQNLV